MSVFCKYAIQWGTAGITLSESATTSLLPNQSWLLRDSVVSSPLRAALSHASLKTVRVGPPMASARHKYSVSTDHASGWRPFSYFVQQFYECSLFWWPRFWFLLTCAAQTLITKDQLLEMYKNGGEQEVVITHVQMICNIHAPSHRHMTCHWGINLGCIDHELCFTV